MVAEKIVELAQRGLQNPTAMHVMAINEIQIQFAESIPRLSETSVHACANLNIVYLTAIRIKNALFAVQSFYLQQLTISSTRN